MKDKLIGILAEMSSVPAEEIRESSRLTGDLGLSSLDLMNLLARCEEEFGIEVDDRFLPEIQTVGDALKLIESRKAD